jgi:hypothetical protein
MGAIGFRNSPADSAADQTWVLKKFKQDLQAAMDSGESFGVFTFFTNVRLTVGQRRKLTELGKEMGGVSAEIFDRENLRLTLDSPEGLAARYQFLQISMNEAEQASFFSRWGADLENLVTRSFASVEDRLRRLEFMHEKSQRLMTLGFHLTLKDAVAIAELPHVRAFVSIARLTRDVDRSQWHVGVCDNAPIRAEKLCGSGPCLTGAFWLADATKPHGTNASTRQDPFRIVGASGGFSEFSEPEIVASLADLEDGMFAFFMNRNLFDHVESIQMYANEYLLWSATAAEVQADAPNTEPKTPWQFTPAELLDPWIRVMARGGPSQLHFASRTPRRMRDAKGLDDVE